MNKVASYLQEHIQGEVSTRASILDAMSRDASVLEVTPEMVIYPRITNDIRKITRFAWQLAEKGHIMPITARGGGSDQTGAAIGSGIILSFPAHMNRIFEYESKHKLVRLQPGVNAAALNNALMMHGVAVPAFPVSASYSTVGGAVANNASGPLSGRYGDVGSYVHQLEVVLANGELLQTGRISRRELDKKKGLQTFEGELYRNLDNLIEDNKQIIAEKLESNGHNNVGYSSLAEVKQKDGSFDLTPLFIGSQGTLGVISEIIMKTEFMSTSNSVTIASFSNKDAARDALDYMQRLSPSALDYFEAAIFEEADKRGKKYDFCNSVLGTDGAVIIVVFDDFSERLRRRKTKKLQKELLKVGAQIANADGEVANELLAVREVTNFIINPAGASESAPPLFDGVYVPANRFEDFSKAVVELAARHHVDGLPLHGRALDSIYFARPILQLKNVADKQKAFKLLDEYARIVSEYDGNFIGEAGEGRLKTYFAYKSLDEDVIQLFLSLKSIMDPFGILNPGVKQVTELKNLTSDLRPDYDMSAFAEHSLYN
jgi:FAD/FMN-containing dehydrogenase